MVPSLLGRAFTADAPGAAVPPGPRMNMWRQAGGVVVPLTGRLRDLLVGLWQPGDMHRRADGTLTRTPQRPVPSAGGAYPVHTHVLVGSDGLDDYAPGLYVYDHENSQLLLRHHAHTRPDFWFENIKAVQGSQLVFSVQPGRSFGRYRHRAWPLWIADVAYAQRAVEFLLARPLDTVAGPSEELRRLIGVPPAAVSEVWLSHGLVPEIPLAAVSLPRGWRVDGDRSRALAARRSLHSADFVSRGDRVLLPAAVEVAGLSGQAWVSRADRVETWSVPTSAPAHVMAEAVWQAHLAAASLTYSSTLSGRWGTRPVSGIAAVDGHWIIHAVAMRDLRHGIQDRKYVS